MADIAPLAVSISEAVKICSTSRSSLYAAINRGELTIKKRGRRSLIELAALKDWLASLPAGGNRAT
jgi:excisionase family DNA binding protein